MTSSFRYRRYAARARDAVRRGEGSGLYRNGEEGIILGVCAGLADHFGLYAWVVRILAIVALSLMTMPVLVAYLILGLLLPERPLSYGGDRDSERSFWSRRERPRDDHGGITA